MRPSEQLYLQRILKVVAPYLPSSCQLLDAGCGEGKIAAELQALGHQVTAIDIEAHFESWQRLAKSGVEFFCASVEKLPFTNASFDAVWVKDTLHHVAHPKLSLTELQRVTKPGGPVIVIEPNRYNPWFYIHLTLLGGHQHFTRRRLKKMLGAADPAYAYHMVESRCLPWDATYLLSLLQKFEEVMEAIPVFRPWLTYQIGVVKGKGR